MGYGDDGANVAYVFSFCVFIEVEEFMMYCLGFYMARLFGDE